MQYVELGQVRLFIFKFNEQIKTREGLEVVKFVEKKWKVIYSAVIRVKDKNVTRRYVECFYYIFAINRVLLHND